jgi:itaconyl-CoA hydratase
MGTEITPSSSGPEEKEEGPFYEDFRIGDVLRHTGGRTLTDTDNIWFTLLTCNTNQIHYNKEYVQENFSGPPFEGKLVVNSLFVLGVVFGLSVSDTSRNGIMLGMHNWKVVQPTFAGDTISSKSEVTGKRESKSHPSMGIVTVRTQGFKQKDSLVMEFERSFMVRKANQKWE